MVKEYHFVRDSGKMFQGQYNATIDEKGRLTIPGKLKELLGGDCLVVTNGDGKNLWCYLPKEWQKTRDQVLENVSQYTQDGRLIMRRFISPAQEVEPDKMGRFLLPQALRDGAGLKKDVVVLGMATYIEVWSREAFDAYMADAEARYGEALAEALGSVHVKP